MNARNAHRAAGFNLMEVLVALGIFTLGFVAISSVFPSGALIQRRSTTDTLARQAENNARSIAQMISLTFDTPATPPATATPTDLNYEKSSNPADYVFDDTVAETLFFVRKLHDGANETLTEKWDESLRSYPTTEPNTAARSFYWVPLVQQTTDESAMNPDQWKIFLFVLARETGVTYNATYPDITSGARSSNAVPGLIFVQATRNDTSSFDTGSAINIAPGDPILACDGNTYRVKRVNGNLLYVSGFIDSGFGLGAAASDWGFWYAPIGFDSSGDLREHSPATRIDTLINGPNSTIIMEAD